MEHKKRERGKNYTEYEKERILEIAEKYLEIIENKKTDNVNVQKKLEAWNEIAKQFNATSQTGPRNGYQLKLLYDSIKQRAKKKAEDKSEITTKSEGKLEQKLEIIKEKIIQLKNIELDNPYDSNSSIDNITPAVTLENGTEHNSLMNNEALMVELDDRLGSSKNGVAEIKAEFYNLNKKKKQFSPYSHECDEIKLDILKIRKEKEELERDILVLKRKEMELLIIDKELDIEEKRRKLQIK